MGWIFDLGPDSSFAPGDLVYKLVIYEWDRAGQNPDRRRCQLYIDPNDTTYEYDKRIVEQFLLLDQSSYQFFDDAERNRHYVIFNEPREMGLALGMYMEIRRENGLIDTVGSFENDSLIVLKTLSNGIANDQPSSITWAYMWRNVYKIPAGLNVEDLNISIKKGLYGTETDPNNLDEQISSMGTAQGKYIEILGLDQYNTTWERKPDNLIDNYPAVYRSDLGLLIFPHRTPFDSDTTYGTYAEPLPSIPETNRLPNIYYYGSQTEKVFDSKFYLEYGERYRSSVIELPCSQIENHCLEVYFNGILLRVNIDYLIDYEAGLIYLLSNELLDPDLSLKVNFGRSTPWKRG